MAALADLITNNTMARDQVLGDDYLLMEILSRMPTTKEIYKSMFVSKRWSNLIKTTYFLQIHKAKSQEQQFPLMPALMVTQREGEGRLRGNSDDYLDPEWKEMIAIHHGYRSYVFRSSSNGLLLVEEDSDDNMFEFGEQHLFKVVNFLTDVSIRLPPTPRSISLFSDYKISAALVYEEEEAQQAMEPRYKVVIAPAEIHDGPVGDVLPVLIYSSSTCCWTKSSMRSFAGQRIDSLMNFKPAECINGFVHWYCDPWGIAVMDTKHIGAEMIDIQYIPLPEITSAAKEYYNFGITRSSCNDIWFATMNNTYNIKFWKLPHSTSNPTTQIIGLEEWVLMDSDSLAKGIGSSPESFLKIDALIPWKGDIIVLLRLIYNDGCGIFFYHRQSKSLECMGSYYGEKYLYGSMSPVMEPLTLSSYGPHRPHPSMCRLPSYPSIWKFPSVWICSRTCDICHVLVLRKRAKCWCQLQRSSEEKRPLLISERSLVTTCSGGGRVVGVWVMPNLKVVVMRSSIRGETTIVDQ